MALYSLIPKTCRAVQAYIISEQVAGLPSANIYAHKDKETRDVPSVTIRAENAMPKAGNPGAWVVNVRIWVATSMILHPDDTTTDTISESDDLAAGVFDLFFRKIVREDNSRLADEITTAARAAVYTGSNPELIAAARPWRNLADFKCDYVWHPGGIDIQQDPELNAYMDVLPLQLLVRASTATET